MQVIFGTATTFTQFITGKNTWQFVVLSGKIQIEDKRDTENISVKEFMSKYKYFTLPPTNQSLSHGNHRLCFRIETIAVAHYKT